MKKWRVNTSDFSLFHQVSVNKICSDIKGFTRQIAIGNTLVGQEVFWWMRAMSWARSVIILIKPSGCSSKWKDLQSEYNVLCVEVIDFYLLCSLNIGLPQFNLFSASATFAEAVERFNSNIPYNGLLHAVTQDVSTAVGT